VEDTYAPVRRAIEERWQVHATYAGHQRRMCLPLDGLTDISIHAGTWHTRARSEPQRCIDDVDLEIES